MTLSEFAERMAELPAQADRDWLGEKMIELIGSDENANDFGLSDAGLAELEGHLEAMENGTFVTPFSPDDDEDDVEPRPKKWRIKKA